MRPVVAHDEGDRFCLTDNEALARYLVTDFVSYFGAYKGLPALENLAYRQLDSVEASGDPTSTYSEAVRAGDLDANANASGSASVKVRR